MIVHAGRERTDEAALQRQCPRRRRTELSLRSPHQSRAPLETFRWIKVGISAQLCFPVIFRPRPSCAEL